MLWSWVDICTLKALSPSGVQYAHTCMWYQLYSTCSYATAKEYQVNLAKTGIHDSWTTFTAPFVSPQIIHGRTNPASLSIYIATTQPGWTGRHASSLWCLTTPTSTVPDRLLDIYISGSEWAYNIITMLYIAGYRAQSGRLTFNNDYHDTVIVQFSLGWVWYYDSYTSNLNKTYLWVLDLPAFSQKPLHEHLKLKGIATDNLLCV